MSIITGNENSFPVDLVYLWVNGNDPQWRKKRAAFTHEHYSDEGMDNEARYADSGELKYSLRSANLYAPWIRKIFIVTDNQTPVWLDTSNPKIRIVDHKEILPPEALPTFNSNVIEHCLHRIPDLSEHFLYSNDDMFFNKPVGVEDFFGKNGLPVIRLIPKAMRRQWYWIVKNILKKNISNYNLNIHTAALLIEEKYGKYINHKPHHNIDAYRKSDYSHTFETFKSAIQPTLLNHTRAENDIQRAIYSYLPVAEKNCHVKFVSKATSFRCHIASPDFDKKLMKKSPMLFCLNDSQFCNDDHRRKMHEFLEYRFHEKSPFEK